MNGECFRDRAKGKKGRFSFSRAFSIHTEQARKKNELWPNLLKYIGCIALHINDLLELSFSSFLDEYGFTREDISVVLKAKLTKSNAFRRKHVVCRTLEGGGRPCTDEQRTNAMCVSEGQNCDGGQLHSSQSYGKHVSLPNPAIMPVAAQAPWHFWYVWVRERKISSTLTLALPVSLSALAKMLSISSLSESVFT